MTIRAVGSRREFRAPVTADGAFEFFLLPLDTYDLAVTEQSGRVVAEEQVTLGAESPACEVSLQERMPTR